MHHVLVGVELGRRRFPHPPQLLHRPHYLLATLLLCNAAAMEALPIFLDRLLNPVAAVVISGGLRPGWASYGLFKASEQLCLLPERMWCHGVKAVPPA